ESEQRRRNEIEQIERLKRWKTEPRFFKVASKLAVVYRKNLGLDVSGNRIYLSWVEKGQLSKTLHIEEARLRGDRFALEGLPPIALPLDEYAKWAVSEDGSEIVLADQRGPIRI